MELEEINFSAGNPRAFAEFIGQLDESKVAVISHTDLDGIASARIISEIVQPDILRFLDYEDINLRLVNYLKKAEVKSAIFTDLSIDDAGIVREIEKFARVCVIDHHTFKENLNSERTSFLNAQGYCVAYLCYYLCLKAQDITKLDWLVCCACLSDAIYYKNRGWMNEVFVKYGDKFELNNDIIRKSGAFWEMQKLYSYSLVFHKNDPEVVYNLLPSKIGLPDKLKEKALEVDNEIKRSIDLFFEKRERIYQGYFWEINEGRFPIKVMLINQLCYSELDKTFIFAQLDKDNIVKISARRIDGKINLPALLKKLIENFKDSNGGGHIKAAGCYFPIEHYDEFKKRIRGLKESELKEFFV